MTRIKTYLAVAAFSLLVLGLPAIASAQWRDRDDDYNRGGYGNGGYGNGGYGNNTYYGNIRSTVQNLKIRAKNFERLTERQYRGSRGSVRKGSRSTGGQVRPRPQHG